MDDRRGPNRVLALPHRLGAATPAGGRLLPIRMLWAVIALLLTAVLCRSTGALALGAVGCLTLALSQWVRLPIAPILLLAVPPLYVGLRTSSLWSGEEAVGWLGANFDEGRAQSLDFRLQNENQLVDKALENPVFGWGGWGRSRIRDAEGKEAAVADGLWIIALGERGFVGLVALGLTLLLPAARFARPFPPGLVRTGRGAGRRGRRGSHVVRDRLPDERNGQPSLPAGGRRPDWADMP